MSAPINHLSFEHWVAVRAWIDAGADPEVVFARVGLTRESFQQAERAYVSDLTDESTRGDEELSVRFERVYGEASVPNRIGLFAYEDDDEGPTLPRTVAPTRRAEPVVPSSVEVTERLPSRGSDSALLNRTVRLDAEGLSADSDGVTGGVLSHRILPFPETQQVSSQTAGEVIRLPPPDTDGDEVATLVAPPSRSLLQQASRPPEDEPTVPPSGRTVIGPRLTTVEQLAELLRALQSSPSRAHVLLRYGLTEAALAATILVWRERLRRDRALFETFRDLMQGPAAT